MKNKYLNSLKFGRRAFLQGSVGSIAGAGLAASNANASYRGRGRGVAPETRSLDEIYQAAMDEGGKLIIYAGGDYPGQQDTIIAGFKERFPEIDLQYIIDYSKFHNVRIDAQYLQGNVIPDIAQLQTVNDFTRWAYEGRLMPYKPIGFENIHPLFRDRWGYSMGLLIFAFSYYVNESLSGGVIPSVQDLTKSQWKGKIVSSYPQDDDAVEFLYKLYVDAYGIEWLEAMAAQEIEFNRGSHVAGNVANGGQKTIALGSASSLLFNQFTPATWVVPEAEPFMAWGQRAGIFRSARHPEAAKLYMNWMLSEEAQVNSFSGWSVRTDIGPVGGLPPIWEYENAFLYDFPMFMEDRQQVEAWRQTFALFFGDTQGEPTPGRLGFRPGA